MEDRTRLIVKGSSTRLTEVALMHPLVTVSLDVSRCAERTVYAVPPPQQPKYLQTLFLGEEKVRLR